MNIRSPKPESAAGLLLAVVDDDDLYRDYISGVLRHQCNCRVFDVEDSAAMIEILGKHPIDCVILDYDLGAESGLSIGELIKERYPDPPPIIMLTGEARERTVLKAFRGGFSDFVSKRNLDLDELVEAIRRAVDRKRGERAEREERDRLARLSSFDAKTGLHASDFMKQRIEDLMASGRRQNASFGVIVVRLQELEGIGDAFGYVMRERALQMFAARLQKLTRQADICGRYEDDGFMYLIDREAGPRTLTGFCERLSRDLSFEANFEKASFTFKAAIGAALFPQDGATVEQLTGAAETALAQARAAGLPFGAPFLGREEAVGAVGAAPSEAGSSHLVVNRQGDRRSERRQRVLKRGKILLKGIESVVDCMIRDLSSGGARIRVDQYYTPPDRFELVIVDSGETRLVDVRWRIANELGLQFLP